MFRSVNPSRAIVHRTIAFRSSNLGRNDKKDTHQMVCVFFVISVHFRYRILATTKCQLASKIEIFRSQVSTPLF